MLATRRFLLAAGTLAIAPAAAVAQPAKPAWQQDKRMEDRVLGGNAPVTVEEYYSLTCPHCAHFAQDVLPKIKSGLIDTGKIRYILSEYPRDRLDLDAMMIARALPPPRYEPFMMALFSTQADWAFDQSRDSHEELVKMAVLAGMTRDGVAQTLADDGLRTAILTKQDAANKAYAIDSTPTFIVGNHPYVNIGSYEDFIKIPGIVPAAG